MGRSSSHRSETSSQYLLGVMVPTTRASPRSRFMALMASNAGILCSDNGPSLTCVRILDSVHIVPRASTTQLRFQWKTLGIVERARNSLQVEALWSGLLSAVFAGSAMVRQGSPRAERGEGTLRVTAAVAPLVAHAVGQAIDQPEGHYRAV